MPPSPGHAAGRMRSESLDTYLAMKSKKIFLFPRPSEPKLEVSDPNSVEYWLPEFEDVSCEVYSDKQLEAYYGQTLDISQNNDSAGDDYDTILSNFYQLKRYMTETQK